MSFIHTRIVLGGMYRVAMAPDCEHTKMQTIKWLATIPNDKKNPRKMQMVFVGGKAVFVPIF